MPVVTVLDFSTGEVSVYSYKKNDTRDLEEIIKEKGHREEDCHYMASEKLVLKVEV